MARTLGAKDKQARKRKLFNSAVATSAVGSTVGAGYLAATLPYSLKTTLNARNPYRDQFIRSLTTEFAVGTGAIGLGVAGLGIAATYLGRNSKQNDKLAEDDFKYRTAIEERKNRIRLSGAIAGSGAATLGSLHLGSKLSKSLPNKALLGSAGIGALGGFVLANRLAKKFNYDSKSNT